MMTDNWDEISREIAEKIGSGDEFTDTNEDDDKARITKDDVLKLFDVLDDWGKNHRTENWIIDLTWDDEGRMNISAAPV